MQKGQKMIDEDKINQYITALKTQIGELFLAVQERNGMIQQLQAKLKKYEPEVEPE